MNTNKIKELRQSKGINQSKMAELLGVKLRAYQYKESGDVPFSVAEVKILMELFGCKFEDIML